MNWIARLVVQMALGTLGSFLAGFVVTELLHPSGSATLWFDTPYGPSFWGTALVLGFCLNLRFKDKTSKWAWVGGVLWLGLWCMRTILEYSPRLSNGRSLSQDLWVQYFSYRQCIEECLTQMFVMTPALSSIAYSLGATLAASLRVHRETTSE